MSKAVVTAKGTAMTVEQMRELLGGSTPAAYKTQELVLGWMFDRQTADEQATKATRHQNTVGFSAAHAWKLSGAARYMRDPAKGGRYPDGKKLGPYYREVVQRFLPHYAAQAMLLVAERAAEAGVTHTAPAAAPEAVVDALQEAKARTLAEQHRDDDAVTAAVEAARESSDAAFDRLLGPQREYVRRDVRNAAARLPRGGRSWAALRMG